MKLNAARRAVAFVLAILMILGVAAVAWTVTVGATVTNYAKGCTYTVSPESYHDSYKDTGSLLTDGAVGTAETSGVTVAYVGTGKTYVILVDLGEVKYDIKTIKFMNVCINGTNRDFGADDVSIAVTETTDKANPETNTYTYDSESQSGTQYFNFIYNLSTEAIGRYVYITIYSPAYVLSLSEIEIWGSGNPAVKEEEPVSVNYALGNTYTVSSAGYVSPFSDTGSLLTDGVVGLQETENVTVAYGGTGKTYTFVFDLGATRDDIKIIKFRNVAVYSNRNFGKDEVVIAATDTLNSSEPVNSTYTYVSEENVNSNYYDFVYTLDSEAEGRYVYITIYSPAYVLSLSEIEILSSPTTSSSIVIPDPIDPTPKFDIELSSASEFKKGETFELLCTVNNITATYGIVAVDFVVSYNAVAFTPMYPSGTDLTSYYIQTAPASGSSLMWEDIGTYCDTEAGNVYMRFAHKTAENGDGVKEDGKLVFKIMFTPIVSSGTYTFEATSCRGTDPGSSNYKKLTEVYANGSSCSAVAAVIPKGLIPVNDNITVTDGYIFGVVPKTTEDDLKAMFEGDVTVTLVKKEVGTGCVVTSEDGISATVVMIGDVDGSGTIDSTDYLSVKKHFLKQTTLTDVAALAADVDGNGRIDSTDYVAIKSHFLGVNKLY